MPAAYKGTVRLPDGSSRFGLRQKRSATAMIMFVLTSLVLEDSLCYNYFVGFEAYLLVSVLSGNIFINVRQPTRTTLCRPQSERTPVLIVSTIHTHLGSPSGRPSRVALSTGSLKISSAVVRMRSILLP